MTTEEALWIADQFSDSQFEDEPDLPRRKRTKEFRNKENERQRNKQGIYSHWENPKFHNETRHGEIARGKRKKGVHIQRRRHLNNVHFAEDVAHANKSRIDRAERSAMRRYIARAPIPQQIKLSLLAHAGSVQFDDDGDEVPSIPLKWIVDGISALQAAHDCLAGGQQDEAPEMPDDDMPPM